MEVTNWVLAPDSCPDNKMTSRLQLVRIILMCHFRLRVIIVLRKQHAERLCSLSYYVFFLLPVQTILVTQIIRKWPSDLATVLCWELWSRWFHLYLLEIFFGQGCSFFHSILGNTLFPLSNRLFSKFLKISAKCYDNRKDSVGFHNW